ncbi:MAG: TIGR03118 family protein [Roseiarcus sp.]
MAAVGFGALCASGGIAQAQFKQTDLVSDISGLAAITDPNLKNTWGVAAIPGASPFWIDNQGTSTSSLYSVTGGTGVAPVNLNGAPGTNFAAIPGVGPTGIVANSGTSFGIAGGPALFIFANLNGSISAWNGSNINSATNNASTIVATTAGASYTGLAVNSTGTLLYAANDEGTGSINVFSSSFAPTTLTGNFTDPNLPAGFVPFNVEDIGGTVYVTYAPAGHTAQTMATAGEGVVATFTESGTFIKNLVTGGPLASPWGMAIAPDGFGTLGGDLLVGNFSAADGDVINVFNSTTGTFVTSIDINPGAGNTPGGLWDLMFGGGGPSGNPLTLYFSDGINGEKDGLFGAITVPEPSTWAMMLLGFGGLGFLAARRRRSLLALG